MSVCSSAFRRKFVFDADANLSYELPPEGRTTNWQLILSKRGDTQFLMKRNGPIERPHTPESIPYVLQNLKAVYGAPKTEAGLDPLDVLIETILSQSTTNANSDRAFENLKRRFPTWEAARRARTASIETAIRSGGLARQKSVRIKDLLNEIHKRQGSLDLSFLATAPLE